MPPWKSSAANTNRSRPSICCTRISKIPSVPLDAIGATKISIYERLISFLPNRRDASALDIGCVFGPFTRHLSPHVDEVIGVDISQEALDGARALSAGHANLFFVQQDVRSIAQIGRQFDLIALLDVCITFGRFPIPCWKPSLEVEALLAPGAYYCLPTTSSLDSTLHRSRRAEFTTSSASARHFVLPPNTAGLFPRRFSSMARHLGLPRRPSGNVGVHPGRRSVSIAAPATAERPKQGRLDPAENSAWNRILLLF